MLEQLKSAWSSLEKEQQTSVVLLGVLGLVAFGLSAYRLRANIFEPFLVPISSLTDTKKIVGDTPEQIEARSRRTDTDGDGLSDWSENNIYHTNPNLRDSCGDGIPDNVRVATGKNLGCGKTTDYSSALNGDAQASGTRKLSDLSLGSFAQYGTTGDAGPNDTAQAFQATIPRDATIIRSMLQGQVPADKLKLMTDQELLSLYDQAIAIQAGQNPEAIMNASSTSASSTGTATLTSTTTH